jgi:hypothetical protein
MIPSDLAVVVYGSPELVGRAGSEQLGESLQGKALHVLIHAGFSRSTYPIS